MASSRPSDPGSDSGADSDRDSVIEVEPLASPPLFSVRPSIGPGDFSHQSPGRYLGRRAIVLLSLVFVVAVLGFLFGIRQPVASPIQRRFATPGGSSHAPRARNNLELASHPWSDDGKPWVADATRPPDWHAVTPRDAGAKKAALEARAKRRAFEGAPPSIPHPIGQGSAVECRACHEFGARIGNAVAPMVSHDLYTSCTQCHVVEVTSIPATGTRPGLRDVGTDFEPLREAAKAYRWSTNSPPQIPHTTNMRGTCNSCHGVNGRPGLQTSHPERKSCQQCHAPSHNLDQRP